MEHPGPYGPRTERWLTEIAADTATCSPRDLVERAERLVDDHDRWRWRCLNMNPAESGLSQRVQRLLANDMAARLTEGMVGDKVYPHGPQNAAVDELEALVVNQVRAQFGARFVEWRPVSTSMANAVVFFALLGPHDTMLVQDEDGGGNYSYNRPGPAGLTPRDIVPIPWSGETFEFDLDRLAGLALERRPKMIVVGGSNVLFPYPLRELRAIADRVGAILVYDAAHLGLLISSGDFQRPLDEGAHIVTLSTHKIMGGPVGGLVLTNDPGLADAIAHKAFPAFLQTRDQNKYAALVAALAETAAFGPALARRMVANARALAEALEAKGFRVLARERGYTQTHQIFLDLGEAAQDFERRCQLANILVSDCALAGDRARGRRSGARLAVHELTRRGLDEADMHIVAHLMWRAVVGDEPKQLARAVAELLDRYPQMKYSFDAPDGAAAAPGSGAVAAAIDEVADRG